jgi:MFS transporter, DHA2 family, multidrug resistance protein
LGQTIGATLVALMFNVFTSNGTVVCLILAASVAAIAAGVSSLRLLLPPSARKWG